MKIFGHNMEKIAGGCTKYDNEEIQIIDTSTNIRLLRLRRIRLTVRVVLLRMMRNTYKIWWGNPEC
jgi:hypothetical protein